MPRRYFVQTSDDKITGLTDIDAVAVPDDHTAVLETVIRAADPPGADGRIQAGGKWDGSAYTAPSGGGVLDAYDDSTALGRRKIAATELHEYLQVLTAGIHAVRHGETDSRCDGRRAVHRYGPLGQLRHVQYEHHRHRRF